jgi:hypothetical protein
MLSLLLKMVLPGAEVLEWNLRADLGLDNRHAADASLITNSKQEEIEVPDSAPAARQSAGDRPTRKGINEKRPPCNSMRWPSR